MSAVFDRILSFKIHGVSLKREILMFITKLTLLLFGESTKPRLLDVSDKDRRLSRVSAKPTKLSLLALGEQFI